MYLSSTPSTSSTSIGISALTFFGLYSWFDTTFPLLFMLSTCSEPQVSMLRLLTLLTCVPSFLCNAAQRMHKKMPRFQLAHPGFFEPQSAHRSFPGTVRMRSWSVFSWRACCLLDMAEVMVVAGRREFESWVAQTCRLVRGAGGCE